MPPSSRPHVNRYVPSNRFPIGIKWLLIANVGIFLVGFILRFSLVETLLRNLALVPSDVVQRFQVWEVVTYLFVHGSSIMLILWNMLALWMFGAELERLWGTVKFLRFYLSCGVIAALAVIVCAYLFGGPDILTIGSSAAINGVLVAYGLMFPNNTILFGFLIPMKSKYFVMIIGGIIFLQSYMAASGGQAAGIALAAQLLTGLLAGFLLLRGRRLNAQVRAPVEASFKEWKLRRAKKKFQVYLKKKDSDHDRWVH
jgi:membrane associated rhomboid family serine protease